MAHNYPPFSGTLFRGVLVLERGIAPLKTHRKPVVVASRLSTFLYQTKTGTVRRSLSTCFTEKPAPYRRFRPA
jgi:hypothetical protein